MSKKSVLANASVEAISSVAFKIAGEINMDSEAESYTIVKGVPIQQFNGSIAKTNGVLDSTGTVLAMAIARPGAADYKTGENNSLSKALMYGDIAIVSFDNKAKKPGIAIMQTSSWMIMQVKDSSGEERAPFIRTPWDVQVTINQKGSMKPPTLTQELQVLANAAINLAADECVARIKNNKQSQSQDQYSTAIKASAELAVILTSRKPERTVFVDNSVKISSEAANLFK